MPHSTAEATMTTNGASNNSQSSSKFLNHVTSYPVVNSSIETFKSHPYGKQALEIADSTYQRFGKPVEPYLEGPYAYAKPYVAKADELADSGLQRVDGRFPIMKEDTDKVLETSRDYVFWPINYLYGTYNGELALSSSSDESLPLIPCVSSRRIPQDRLPRPQEPQLRRPHHPRQSSPQHRTPRRRRFFPVRRQLLRPALRGAEEEGRGLHASGPGDGTALP